jgi:hypothetical protein
MKDIQPAKQGAKATVRNQKIFTTGSAVVQGFLTVVFAVEFFSANGTVGKLFVGLLTVCSGTISAISGTQAAALWKSEAVGESAHPD